MGNYVLKRLGLMVVTLVGISIINFAIINFAPGAPARIAVAPGEGMKDIGVSQQAVDTYKKFFHLDKPVHTRYLLWLADVVQGDFGRSTETYRPVWERIRPALPITMIISFISVVIAYVVAIPVGVWASTRHRTVRERGVTLLLFALYSLPAFWVATMLLVYFASSHVAERGVEAFGHVFMEPGKTYVVGPPVGLPELFTFRGEDFKLFHPKGVAEIARVETTTLDWLGQNAWHLLLPIICYTYASFAGLSRYKKSAMLQILRDDYIRTARAKGLHPFLVVWKHGVRNGLIPIVTLFAGLLPELIGGSVIIEYIFDIPGMGQLAFHSITSRDYPTLMAINMLTALLVLVGILLSDILYAVVDPRITFK
ncbi:MAG: ABC transporter permease [Planctomycetes bacterium]|nr:ABC transporter permease [Planctomycetota bacterium]